MRQWRLHGGWKLLTVLLIGGGLLAPAGGWAAITVSPEFVVAPFATGLRAPTALAFGPGGPTGEWLYVVEGDSGGGTGRLVAFDPSGQATVLAERLWHPTDLAVGAGGTWGRSLYILEREGSGSLGLRVTQVSPGDKATRFPFAADTARVPGGVLLSMGGAWGEALYLSDAAEGHLVRLSPTGAVSVFLKGLSGPRALALPPPGSPFGEGLYVATSGAVVQVEPDGRTSVLVEDLVAPSALAFGVGGALGWDLYLGDGGLAERRLLRITPASRATPVAEGFGSISGLALAPGAPFGPAVFVADAAAGRIYQLIPVSP